MTTKSGARAQVAAPWTRQVISFGTSFAFFGLASVLQNAFAAEQLAQEQEAARVAAQQAFVAAQDAIVDVEEPILGPVPPAPDADFAVTTSAEPEVAPVPTVVSTPVQPVEQIPVDGESGGS